MNFYLQIEFVVDDQDGYPKVWLKQKGNNIIVKLTEGIFYNDFKLNKTQFATSLGYWAKKHGKNPLLPTDIWFKMISILFLS